MMASGKAPRTSIPGRVLLVAAAAAMLCLHRLGCEQPGTGFVGVLRLGSSRSQRHQHVQRLADEKKERGYFDDFFEQGDIPEWRTGIAGRRGSVGFLGAVGLLTLYWATRDEETRRMKICVRSKEFERDFFNDPFKKEWAEKKGVKLLQDPDCVELSEAWQKLKPF
mmetsp:Transcript_21455/g.34313  ORF Transcript_21455/g.34313 Transcript_21455/m.34313 type:complete len:166 (-) Transcript_21455:65-562(-)